jgi:hypothetical protein
MADTIASLADRGGNASCVSPADVTVVLNWARMVA